MGGFAVNNALWDFALPDGIAEGETLTVMIRPEHMLPCGFDDPGAVCGTVEAVTFLGSTLRVLINCPDNLKLIAEQPSTSAWAGLQRHAAIAVKPDLAQLVLLDRPIS
jgi:hypothetical protein